MTRMLYEANAFTANGENGNPAGVVLDADDLTERRMQAIATDAGFPETAFVLPSRHATRRVRFFTTTGAVDLCGHATVATWLLLHERGQDIVAGDYAQETKAGVLGITIAPDGLVFMEQTAATFSDAIPRSDLASLLGITEQDFHPDLPPQIVSTGLNDILVPVVDKTVLDRLQPNLKGLAAYSRRHDGGFHVFALLEKLESIATTRNFDPAHGINEEAATGTSNGALLCYLRKYGIVDGRDVYRIEQGEAMGRLSHIYGKFKNDIVWIGGYASLVREVGVSL